MTRKAVVVTDEMRRAVYRDDCRRLGHKFQLDIFQPVTGGVEEPAGAARSKLGSRDNRLPHVTCSRCEKTWLLLRISGRNYDAVLAKVKDLMKDPTTVDVDDSEQIDP